MPVVLNRDLEYDFLPRKGATGLVVGVDNISLNGKELSIQFDKPFKSGHSCDGRSNYDCGRYFFTKYIDSTDIRSSFTGLLDIVEGRKDKKVKQVVITLEPDEELELSIKRVTKETPIIR